MMAMVTAGQMKPAEMVGMIASLKDISGPDDTIDKMHTMVDAVAALKGLASDEGEGDSKLDKAERFVRDAVTPALGEVAKMLNRPGAEQGQQAPQVYQPTQQAPNLPGPVMPGPIPVQSQVTPGTQQPQVPPASSDEITVLQWGKILEFVVDATSHPAQEAASHLLTHLKAIDAMPALDVLSAASLPEIKGRVNLALASGKVQDAYFVGKMQQFVALADSEQGQEWLEEFLRHTRSYYQAVRERVRQQAAAMQEQAAQEQAAQQAAQQAAAAQAAAAQQAQGAQQTAPSQPEPVVTPTAPPQEQE
jgi:hypothetical protein